MKKLTWLVIVFIFILSFTGCGSSSSSNGTASNAKSSSQDMAPAATSNTANSNAATSSTTASSLNDKKIVYICDLNIATDNVKETQNKIDLKAAELKGYITDEALMDSNGNSTVRIPMENYKAFLDYIDKNCTLKNKKQQSSDVTDAYVDNEARLNNLKLQESQLQELMKKAYSIDDIMKVQAEISKVRGDIESLSGKKKLWDNQVSYSTVNVVIYKNETGIASKELSIIGIGEFGNSIAKGFVASTKTIILVIESILIFVLSNIFYFIIIGGIGFLFYRYYKKHNIK